MHERAIVDVLRRGRGQTLYKLGQQLNVMPALVQVYSGAEHSPLDNPRLSLLRLLDHAHGTVYLSSSPLTFKKYLKTLLI